MASESGVPIRPIRCLLVANRGEIAGRIFRTCRRSGYATVAVYTEADRRWPFVAAADQAVLIPGYLDGPAIIAAALRSGADAIHPGYGFLSENADFAALVIEAGLNWVGPSPAVIRSMGSKAEARRLMAARGVPVVPGYDGVDQTDASFVEAAAQIGLPVLVKASAGGGGKGMQVVREAGELVPALAAARRLALSAFGDDRVILERYLERPRHIEAQVLGDKHGRVVHLFERECSIQRRHQKVIEEAPSPAFAGEEGETRRERLLHDAVEAASAVGYTSVGTVEFIVDSAGQHYFLEMNTRLQVEHPVTECISQQDIVLIQIQIAEGRPLTFGPDCQDIFGHSIEARLYAEDPDAGHLPQGGSITFWSDTDELRVDAGVQTGTRIGTSYDPMLAKLVAWGENREEALRVLCRGLADLRILGIRSNREWLGRVLGHPAFAAGDLHTGFLQEHEAALGPELRPALGHALAALVEHILERRSAAQGAGRPLPGLRPGWRSNPWPPVPYRVELDGKVGLLFLRDEGEGFVLTHSRYAGTTGTTGLSDPPSPPSLADEAHQIRVSSRVILEGARRLELEVDGHCRAYTLAGPAEGPLFVQTFDRTAVVRILPDLEPPVLAPPPAGSLAAPMPGKVVRLAVNVGQRVERGQVLVVLEAMKMEQAVKAPVSGQVSAVLCAEGAQVEAGQSLIVVNAVD